MANDEEEYIELDEIIPMTGKQRKNIGHSAERRIAKLFREELKQEYCETSRANSKLLDKCGIDLDNVPLRVQIKAGEQKNFSAIRELIYIHFQSIKFLVPESEWLLKPKILILCKTRKIKGQPRTRPHELDLVFITDIDFGLMLNNNHNFIPDTNKLKYIRNRNPTNNEFDNLVCITLNYFIEIFPYLYSPHLKIKQ